MPHNYQAIFKNGQIKWLDTSPPQTTAKVIVTVLEPLKTNTESNASSSSKKRQLGFMQGEMTLPDDINWGDEQVKEIFESHECITLIILFTLVKYKKYPYNYPTTHP